MAEPLVTPADLELATELGLSPERAAQLLAQASAAVRAFCGWVIAPAETGAVFTVDGTGSRVLTLPTMLLTGVTSVSVDGTDMALTDFEWSSNGVLERAGGWNAPRRGVTVVADHGYVATPDEVSAVVISMCARAAASPLGEVRTQTGPFSVTYSTTGPGTAGGVVLLDRERWALGPYRVPR